LEYGWSMGDDYHKYGY